MEAGRSREPGSEGGSRWHCSSPARDHAPGPSSRLPGARHVAEWITFLQPHSRTWAGSVRADSPQHLLLNRIPLSALRSPHGACGRISTLLVHSFVIL